MSQLFNKAAVFTDFHAGEHRNSEVFLSDCEDFIDWFLDQAKANNCDRIIFCGDLFHNMVNLEMQVVTRTIDMIERLAKTLPVEMVVGNHDMYSKASRNIHSLRMFEYMPNVRVWNEPSVVDGVAFVPFLVGTEYTGVMKMEAEYMFGHLELPTFMLNNTRVMEDHGGLEMDQLDGLKHVFSGHFHRRQQKVNKTGVPFTYIGSPFGHNFSDDNDDEHGMMILEWGQDPVFINWTNSPKYITADVTELSHLVDNGYINPKTYLRVTGTDDLSHEDHIELQTFLGAMTRSARIPPRRAALIDHKDEVEIDYEQNTDTLVVDFLNKMDLENSKLDPKKLVDLYQRY